MCTEVVISAQPIEHVCWLPDDLAIHVPNGTTLTAALADIRAILVDLGAPSTGPLTCWCGERITLPIPLLLEDHSGTPTHQQPQADRI